MASFGIRGLGIAPLVIRCMVCRNGAPYGDRSKGMIVFFIESTTVISESAADRDSGIGRCLRSAATGEDPLSEEAPCCAA
jgi:hypothetical protein